MGSLEIIYIFVLGETLSITKALKVSYIVEVVLTLILNILSCWKAEETIAILVQSSMSIVHSLVILANILTETFQPL